MPVFGCPCYARSSTPQCSKRYFQPKDNESFPVSSSILKISDPVTIPFQELRTRAENELPQNAILNTTMAFLRKPSRLLKSDQYIFKGNVNISSIEEWRNLYFPPVKEGSYYVSLVMLYKNETAWTTKIFHSNMFFMYGKYL